MSHCYQYFNAFLLTTVQQLAQEEQPATGTSREENSRVFEPIKIDSILRILSTPSVNNLIYYLPITSSSFVTAINESLIFIYYSEHVRFRKGLGFVKSRENGAHMLFLHSPARCFDQQSTCCLKTILEGLGGGGGEREALVTILYQLSL